jgi:hypothetical protein
MKHNRSNKREQIEEFVMFIVIWLFILAVVYLIVSGFYLSLVGF